MKQTLAPTAHRHDHGHLPTRSLQVPLLSTGEVHSGYFTVPAAAVQFKPHTNEVLRYEKVVREKVGIWIEWKRRQGWAARGKPRVLAPVPVPTAHGEEADEESVRVYVQATFYRTKPMHMGLDAFLARMDTAKRYGVDISQGRSFQNELPETVDHIVPDSPAVDPMQEAEQRRRTLGLKREVEVKDGVIVGARLTATSPATEGENAAESSTPR